MKESDNKKVVKGCFVGCATATVITLFILVLFVIWLYLPYTRYPLPAYFAKEHVLAAQFQISMKNKTVQRACWSLVRMLSRNRHKDVPAKYRELAVAKDMDNLAHLKQLPLFDLNFLATVNQQEDQWLFMASVPAQGKLCQLLFNLSTIFIPQRSKRFINGALVITRDGTRGFSLFKGHGLMGQIEPTLALATKVIAKGPNEPKVDNFVAKHWPKGGRLVSLAIDNRFCTFDRIVKEETNFIGVAAIAQMLGLNEMGVVGDFYLKKPMNKLEFERWLRKATDTLLPDPFAIDIKKIEQYKGYYRATLSVKGISTAVDQLEEISKNPKAQ